MVVPGGAGARWAQDDKEFFGLGGLADGWEIYSEFEVSAGLWGTGRRAVSPGRGQQA